MFLGKCYLDGDGVPQDQTKAFSIFKEGAEQGVAQAQELLGECYEYGKGTEPDTSKALEWYRKAAENGNRHAQFLVKDAETNGYY